MNTLTKYNQRGSLLDELVSEPLFRPIFRLLDADIGHDAVTETKTEYVLELELPRFRKEEVQVEVTPDGILRVDARQKGSAENRKYYERFIGHVVDTTKASAHLEHGILKITLPKTERAQARQIVVT